MSNARLQLDMDFVPLWKQKYAEQIEFTFMWINIQNSSGALVITIWPLDPRVLNKEGSFQIFELTGMELWVFGYMKNINTKSISSISLSYILGKETHTSLSHCPLLNFELCILFGTNECLNADRVCPCISLCRPWGPPWCFDDKRWRWCWHTRPFVQFLPRCGQTGLLGSTDNTNRQYFMSRRGIPEEPRGGICLVNKSDG